MFVGREAEQARLAALIGGARHGTSAALIVFGEPGIGKTSLLEQAALSAGDFLALRAQPLQAESELPFAGLSDLLRPILDLRDRIPGPQQAALDGALALGPPLPGDRFAVAAATLSVLAVAADQSPVLAIVDDAHWLDTPSRDALLFAGRRLGSEGVVLLFAMRDRDWLHSAGLGTLPLRGLEPADATALVRDADGELDAGVRNRLVTETRGNPLAVLEAVSTLTEAERRGRAPIAHPLAVGASLEQAFAQQLEDLPADTRRALLIAAASDTGSAGEALAALAELGLTAAHLEPAERTGVITITAERISFRHPLVRSAAYHAHDPAARRDAHRALAAAVGTGDRAVWHRAAAAVGPDEEVAALLETAGASALGRSAYAAAASAFESAAVLSPGDGDRLRRTIGAGRALWLGGDPDRAVSLLEGAVDLATDPVSRARVQMLRGTAMVFTRPVAETFSLLVGEAERIGQSDRLLASQMFSAATMVCFMSGDTERAEATARRALDAAGPDAGVAGQTARLTLGLGVAGRGKVAEALGLIEPVLAQLGPAELGNPDGGLALALAGVYQALVWTERSAIARNLIEAMVAAARSAGAATVLPFALATLSEIDLRSGRIAAAYAAAAESVELARDTAQTVESSFSRVTLARVHAVLGHEADCRALVATALEQCRRTGADSIRTYATSVLGLLELTLGRPDHAAPVLRECARIQAAQGMRLLTPVQWAGDLIEALVRSGDVPGAERALASIESSARDTGLRWVRAVAARGRGLVADEPAYEREFATALELHGDEMPYERARTQLCLGMRLRRSRRRADARVVLHDALTYFDLAGCDLWAAQVRAELRAAGETQAAAAVDQTSLRSLTPQELRVAMIVATGATNKEAAAALFLSPKTVEFHLSNAYRKLGVRSRAELVRKVEGLS